jgi:quercetin dioxygenase-like cupin family protein
MPKVSVVAGTDAKERSVAKSKAGAAYHQQKYKVDKFPYFPYEGESLELFEVELGPDADVAPHAHSEDEIIYLLTGEIRLGSRTMEPGDALFVAKDTLYGFKVGPQGCTFLNFRPTPNPKYISKEQFLENRGSQ